VISDLFKKISSDPIFLKKRYFVQLYW